MEAEKKEEKSSSDKEEDYPPTDDNGGRDEEGKAQYLWLCMCQVILSGHLLLPETVLYIFLTRKEDNAFAGPDLALWLPIGKLPLYIWS